MLALMRSIWNNCMKEYRSLNGGSLEYVCPQSIGRKKISPEKERNWVKEENVICEITRDRGQKRPQVGLRKEN